MTRADFYYITLVTRHFSSSPSLTTLKQYEGSKTPQKSTLSASDPAGYRRKRLKKRKNENPDLEESHRSPPSPNIKTNTTFWVNRHITGRRITKTKERVREGETKSAEAGKGRKGKEGEKGAWRGGGEGGKRGVIPQVDAILSGATMRSCHIHYQALAHCLQETTPPRSLVIQDMVNDV